MLFILYLGVMLVYGLKNVVSGTCGCVPIVFQSPINTLKGLRAEFGIAASCFEFFILFYI